MRNPKKYDWVKHNMPKREKIRILKKMLEIISEDDWDIKYNGLCSAYAHAALNTSINCAFVDPDVDLIGIGIKKPIVPYDEDWWWSPFGQLDERKEAIKAALKRHQRFRS